MAQTTDTHFLSRLKRKLFFLRSELIIFGLLGLFIGLYPILLEQEILPAFFKVLPVEGTGYRTLVMILGGLALIVGMRAFQKRNL